ncbi:hypothetical protein [Plantactinospora sp. B5E13]|uniref:hypothetical protein n=1 Tax=unclassified Plantactinospora TaxID=2631981 RepID=UPI00325EEAA2
MRDVREIFAEVAAGPTPPMASSEVMVAAARRAERRRRLGLTTGSAGVLVLALTAGVAVGVARPRPEPEAAAGAPVSPSSGPGIRDGADLLDAVAAVLPAELAIRRDPAGRDVRTRDVADVDTVRPGTGLAGVRLIAADAVVYASWGAGELGVSIRDARTARDPALRSVEPAAGEFCSRPAGPPGNWPDSTAAGGSDAGGGAADCRSLAVGDKVVRVRTEQVSGDDPGSAAPGVTCWTATRFLPGLEINVRWCPAATTIALPAPVPQALLELTAEQLAALAVEPVLVPAVVTGR